MSRASESAAFAPVSAVALALAGLVFAKRVIRAVINRRAINHLATMDERMLKDIGLTRLDVEGARSAPLLDDPTRRLAEMTGRSRLPEQDMVPAGSASTTARTPAYKPARQAFA
jgi:uncharacterized protein YjiS (DUF1127 family)